MTRPPFILVDDRQVDWYPDALRRAGFNVRVKRIEAGDVVFDSPLGRVGIEDKPYGALLDDRRNGRLDDELRRLASAYAVPILMVRLPGDDLDGLAIPPPKSGWTFDGVQNLLVGRQLHGIMLDFCEDSVLGVGRRVRALHDYLARVGPLEARKGRTFPWLEPLDDRAEIIYQVLSLVKGIRNRRSIAEAIAAKFPVGDVLRWSQEDWRRAGFSKTMSARLFEVVSQL